VSPEGYVFTIWVTGAVVTAAWFALPGRSKKLGPIIEKHGWPNTPGVAVAVVAFGSAIWFVLPFLLLLDKREPGS
jgi:hypothetical protein